MMDVKSCLVDAVLCHARSGDLTQSVNIETVDVEDALDLLAHLLCPGLRAVDAGL